MAVTTFAPGFTAGLARRKAPIAAFAKRLVNTIIDSRTKAAEAELRRLEFLVRETALAHGEYRAVGLGRADLLPFNS